jgi:hypothetical protein
MIAGHKNWSRKILWLIPNFGMAAFNVLKNIL